MSLQEHNIQVSMGVYMCTQTDRDVHVCTVAEKGHPLGVATNA